jgi:hypothetical protein
MLLSSLPTHPGKTSKDGSYPLSFREYLPETRFPRIFLLKLFGK